MSQNHGRGRTGDQFDEKIIIVRGALKTVLWHPRRADPKAPSLARNLQK